MDDNITITIPESSYDIDNITSGDVTIDSSILNSSLFGPSSYSIGTGAIGATGSAFSYTTNGSSSWGSLSAALTSTPGLSCSGDANFEGDVKIKGVSIAKALEDIQKRLAILVPDPAKLEHFTALKKAYDHYKTLEALCEIPTKDD